MSVKYQKEDVKIFFTITIHHLAHTHTIATTTWHPAINSASILQTHPKQPGFEVVLCSPAVQGAHAHAAYSNLQRISEPTMQTKGTNAIHFIFVAVLSSIFYRL